MVNFYLVRYQMHLVVKSFINDFNDIFNCFIRGNANGPLTSILILRFVQGLTGGGAIVIAKASAGDKLHGNALAKFLAALMGVNGIITIIAPLIGGWSLKLGSWHVIFIVLTIVTFILIIGVLSQMPETAKDTHSKLNFSHIFSDFGQLLRKPKLSFLCYYKD